MKNLKLTKALEQIGLSQQSIKVYFLLFNDSELSITQICNHLGMYRAKIYDFLEELKEFDLISRENDYSRKIFVASPSVVFNILKRKQYELNRSLVDLEEEMPNILASYSDKKGTLDVKVFDGENKFIYLMTSILDECVEGSEMISYNEGNDLYDIFDATYFLETWVNRRIQKLIFNKILLNRDNKFTPNQILQDKTKYRECRVLETSNSEQGCYWVIGNKVIFWDTLTPKAVLIENKTIAQLLKSNFYQVWDNLD